VEAPYQPIYTEPWIETAGWDKLPLKELSTPAYVISEQKLEDNLKILGRVQKETGSRIVAALKAFSMFTVFPLMRKYLAGTEASSVYEARLGFEESGPEVHTFSPAYTEQNIDDFIRYSSHLSFNSFSQWERVKSYVLKSGKRVSPGIRVNPEHSESAIDKYNPCAPYSHFGVKRQEFEGKDLEGLEGLHFHTLCELGADAFERTLASFEEKFGGFLPQMKWVNFGGGHHITRPGYDVELMIRTINGFRRRYPHLDIYLEPGEAIALNAGVLAATVIDTFYNGIDIAVLDVSATCHMPDVLEIPYQPAIGGAEHAFEAKDNSYIYRLVGPTCLTGDVTGHYAFDRPLKPGNKMLFMNMAIYTMVKNNTFNGIGLPDIVLWKKDGSLELVKQFGYEDFKERLG
jgi:carboxynorspermidine decarboxylase